MNDIGLSTPLSAVSVPIPTPKNSGATFSNAAKMKEFLASHPKSQRFFIEGSKQDPIVRRQVAVTVATAKIMEECGTYPSQGDKKRLAEVLGEILGLHPSVFFDPASHSGYIANALHNRRRKLASSDRKFTWSDARKRLKVTDDSSSPVQSTQSSEPSPGDILNYWE